LQKKGGWIVKEGNIRAFIPLFDERSIVFLVTGTGATGAKGDNNVIDRPVSTDDDFC